MGAYLRACKECGQRFVFYDWDPRTSCVECKPLSDEEPREIKLLKYKDGKDDKKS